MLKLTIKQRLKRFFEYLKVKSGKEYDFRTIKLKFTSNIPSDLLMLNNVINQLQHTISQETALSLLSFVENPKVELVKFMEEKQLYEGIDLDKVVDNEETTE